MGEFVSRYRWVMVAITWLMMFSLGASWFCFTPMQLILMNDLSLDFSQVGLIIGLVPLSLVLLCIPGGLIADRFGIRKTVLMGGISLGVFGLLRGFATNFTTLALTTFMCGVGYSIAYPNLPKITGIWFPPREYAIASGAMFTGMEVGMALPFILVPTVLLPWVGSWRFVFTIIGVLSLALTLGWILLAREKPKEAVGKPQQKPNETLKSAPFKESLSVVLRNRHMWILMLTTLFLLAPQVGFLGFLQSMLTLKGLDEATAGVVTSLISWFMIPGSFIIPMISDRVGLRKPFIWAISLIAGVTLYAAGTTTSITLWLSVIIYGFLIGGMAPIILAMPVEIVGPRHSATAGGFMLTGGYFGAMVAPWLAGYLSVVTSSFYPAVILCVALTEIDVIFGLMLKESREK
ncbi:MFS transporter [Candidatus Bathyarchaeota archaeon]|nr:MFS transporter [Candidatus Bathyarchaeota archaeon]